MPSRVDAKQIALNLLIGGNAVVALCCLLTPGFIYKTIGILNVVAIVGMLHFVKE